MRALVAALERAQSTRSKKEKADALAEALRDAAARGDEELATCARLVLGRPLATSDPRTLGVGWSLFHQAAERVWRLEPGDLLRRTRDLGDPGDAVLELVAAREGAPGVSLADAARGFDAIAASTSREGKLDALAGLLERASAVEAKYLVKVITGELRVGVREGVLEDAIARAFDAAPKDVRRAASLVVDPGELACLAKARALDTARVRVGTPLGFMLASPVESIATPIDPALTAIEDKLDGVRAQVHVTGGGVRIFARGQGEVTRAFPEIAEGLASLDRELIVDGEILAVDGSGRPRPFQALQARIGRVAPDAELRAEVPVRLFAFDILFDGEPLIDEPWIERRTRLEGALAQAPANVCTVHTARPFDATRPIDEVQRAEFDAARARGAEGLVLKRVDAPYEAGKRGSAWRKVKRELATLDVVVTAAERGHGKRAKVLSDYTFAVWSEGALVDIGKAYSGLTDAEIAALTERFQRLTTHVNGGRHTVTPEVVLEVAFDGLQRSDRHASGLSLRFPRIARVRDDKRAEDADTLATARALFDAQVASGHREEGRPARRASKRAGKDKRQLSLFGDDE